MENETWQIIYPKPDDTDLSNWIEEEERILNWAENPNFNKQSLQNIAISFIYVNLDDEIVGILKSSIALEKQHSSSILSQSIFADKVNIAKNPISLPLHYGENKDTKNIWLEKSYILRDSIIFHASNEPNENKPPAFHPLYFSNDIVKIPNSISVFHDLYEIVIIMRETRPAVILKSIIKKSEIGGNGGGCGGKTKKVRISEESPKEIAYVLSSRSSSSKRKTRKFR